MKVKQPRRFHIFGQVLFECGLYKLWHPYLKVCIIGMGFTCFSSVIVEDTIVILALFSVEQINTIDTIHTKAYQRNILSKFLEWMRESTEVGNNGEEPAKHIGGLLLSCLVYLPWVL